MPTNALNIVIAGVGGQGTVLASKLLANCALQSGAQVRSAETIGMAQRGGSVLGHVRMKTQTDSSALHSPLVPVGAADILIGFEPSETVKALPYLGNGGLVVSAIKALAPPMATLLRLDYDGSEQVAYLQKLATGNRIGQLTLVDGQKTTDELGTAKVLNTVLLGATLSALAEFKPESQQLLSLDSIKATIKLLVKSQFLELNIKALDLGVQICR
jgi:indolepyruvate ferredoxin oxidoreductase beta subunit